MFKLAAYFTRFGSRSDGSAGLSFNTQELSPEDFSELKKSLNAFGWVVFKENDIVESDIPSENVEEEGKSQSQRLRSVMFIFWKENQNKINQDFNSWYSKITEKYIDTWKEKLQ